MTTKEDLENTIQTIDFWLDEWGVGYKQEGHPEATPAMVAVACREMQSAHLVQIAKLTREVNRLKKELEAIKCQKSG